MKMTTRLVLASILGIALILMLNLSAKNLAISGVSLPFGWNGPYYWLTAQSPNDHSSGLPVVMVKYKPDEAAYYTSTFAMIINIACGIGLGLGGDAAFRKLKKRAK